MRLTSNPSAAPKRASDQCGRVNSKQSAANAAPSRGCTESDREAIAEAERVWAEVAELVEFSDLPAGGLVLAEIPERPFRWWAVGITRQVALAELRKIVLADLSGKAVGR